MFGAAGSYGRMLGKQEFFDFFLDYEPVAVSADFLHLKGKAISDAMNAAEFANFREQLFERTAWVI